jgi:hypothetical protein
MDKYEEYLGKGGWYVGNAIGWALRRIWDSMRKSSEERNEREILTPGDPNRMLPPWQMEVCERAVRKALPYYPDPVAGVIKQPTLKLCRDILLYEKSLRKSSAGKMEEHLSQLIYNILRDRLDYQLFDAEGGEREFFVPLLALHHNVANFMDKIPAMIEQTMPTTEPFTHLVAKLQRNYMVASGVDPDRWEEGDKAEPVWPSRIKGMDSPELLERFLGGTPFTHFFNTSLPVSIPLATRFEHMHIVGGSGHGKTQLLQNFILHDIKKLREGGRSVIVIDSQGDMIRKIQSLALLEEISDRVVIINPREIASPPALNLFDLGLDRITHYTPLEQEMLVNGAIEMYKYMFGALFGADLTMRQGTIFRFLASLMMLVPNATIKTFMGFLQEPERTRPYLNRLREGSAVRVFLETEFFANKFAQTRDQILDRLWAVIGNQTLERMFSNEHNKLDLFAAMNRGSLILINTAKDLLKQEGCEILGRFFIALICQAAQERASIADEDRMPTFVYIDEAHDYFDANMENMFNEVRKYAVGLCIAHQNLDQFKQELRSTVTSSTAIKLVGGLSAKDAGFFADNMECRQELLLSMRKYENRSEFACYVRNLTKRPLPLTVPFGAMEKEPTLSASALEAIKAQSRARYCTSTDSPKLEMTDRTNGDHGLGKPQPL